MDLDAEFDHTVSDMKWGEVVSTLRSVIEVLFGDLSYPPPPPPPSPPPAPAPAPPFATALPWSRYNFHPQLPGPLSEGYSQPWHIPEEANPPMFVPEPNWNRHPNPIIHHRPVYDPDFMQPWHFYRQPEQQHLQHIQPPVNYFPMNGAESYLPPLSYPFDGVSACAPSIGIQRERPSVKYRLKKGPRLPDNRGPYVKKPLNAFMLFAKEQKAKVLAQRDTFNWAVFAKTLGKMWESMSNEQKDKYYKQYYAEKRLQALQDSDWSYYATKTNRSATKTGDFPSKPEELSRQANNPCVTPVQTAVMEAHTSHTDILMSPHTKLREPPQTHSAVTLPVCHICQRPLLKTC